MYLIIIIYFTFYEFKNLFADNNSTQVLKPDSLIKVIINPSGKTRNKYNYNIVLKKYYKNLNY